MPHEVTPENRLHLDVGLVMRELTMIVTKINRRRIPEATAEEKKRIAELKERARILKAGGQPSWDPKP